jgi:predicted O-methyltransferase YrrM
LLTASPGQVARNKGWDYISPGLSEVKLDKHFPNVGIVHGSACQWRYFQQDFPHHHYGDRRYPTVPLVNRDEAHILYDSALRFAGKRALEIGSWLGWSTGHLAAGGVIVDAIDPQLADPVVQGSIVNSLKSAGVLNRVSLWAGSSPGLVYELSVQQNRRWSLIFIDANPDHPAPMRDAAIAHEVAETDAIILLHDAISPEVARALEYLKAVGWNVTICYTAQIMGVAWRGNVVPVEHTPDPKLEIAIPEHLKGFAVSGYEYGLPADAHQDRGPVAVETE